VATYVDETPYTSNGSTGLSGSIAPVLEAFDMQRVEVLRGPQGTLYGANAMGGLLKYVTNAPDPSGFAARLDAGLASVEGGGTDYNLHAMVNLPFGDTAALRLVGYDNRYPGFVDDALRGEADVNSSRSWGGRASFLFDATPDLSVRLSAAYQDRSWDDFPNVDVTPGTLEPINGLTQSNLVGSPGTVKNQIYNATVDWDLGFAKLISSSNYIEYASDVGFDVSDTFGTLLSTSVFPLFGLDVCTFSPPFTPCGVGVVPPFFQVIAGPYDYGLTISQQAGMHAFSQELRLASSVDGPLQWQVGGYFTDQTGFVNQDTLPIDKTTRAILTASPFAPYQTGGFDNSQDYREGAVFGNISYSISPTFDVALGGRYSENKQDFREHGFGLLGGDATTGADLIFSSPSSSDVFTYSADARWHVTDDVMLYSRVATGFVPGGGNNVPPLTPGVPRSYEPSTTTSYEGGIKASLFEGRGIVDVALFQVDWNDIQIASSFGGVLTTSNGGAARSQGLEWNVAALPLDGLTVNFSGAYTDAVLTEALTAQNGAAGDRLPGTPLWSAALGATYTRNLTGEYSGFVGFDWRFSGRRDADFTALTATGPRQVMPSFEFIDLRAGIEASNWTLSAFVKNVGDEFAINTVANKTLLGELGPQSANIYPPRSYGLLLSLRY
jgi:outer membrane receptor protein involved in Fe transport